MIRPQNNKNNWKFFIYKVLVVIFTFKVVCSVLKRLVRINYKWITNAEVTTSEITTLGREHYNTERSGFSSYP